MIYFDCKLFDFWFENKLFQFQFQFHNFERLRIEMNKGGGDFFYQKFCIKCERKKVGDFIY